MYSDSSQFLAIANHSYLWPVSSKALLILSTSPDFVALTSQTLTSGVNPEAATNRALGEMQAE